MENVSDKNNCNLNEEEDNFRLPHTITDLNLPIWTTQTLAQFKKSV